MVLQEDEMEMIFDSIRLPCGREVPNRLVKVALYEHGASLFGGLPNQYHFQLYSLWSRGQWGMIFTGNVQVSHTHLSIGRDLILPISISPRTLEPYKRLADAMHGVSEVKPLAIMQLSHSGRQSTTILGGRFPWNPPLAPSAIRVGSMDPKADTIWSRLLYGLLFTTPKEMTLQDIDEVVDAFIHGVKIAFASGFDGIELHASHGYLLAQFISTQSNKRRDDYSAETSPLRLIRRIVTGARQVVPGEFLIGVKLNAADYIDTSAISHDSGNKNCAQEDRALNHIKEIASWGSVDFIEVSGGDYANPEFMAKQSSRQALFSQFSRRAMQALPTRTNNSHANPLILLTGGFRSPSGLGYALAQNHTHLLGIGRLSVLHPDLPVLLKSHGSKFLPLSEPDLTQSIFDHFLAFLGQAFGIKFPRLIGAGAEMSWYNVQMRFSVSGRRRIKMGRVEALVRMWLWMAPSIRPAKYSGHGLGSGFLVVLLASIICLILLQ